MGKEQSAKNNTLKKEERKTKEEKNDGQIKRGKMEEVGEMSICKY